MLNKLRELLKSVNREEADEIWEFLDGNPDAIREMIAVVYDIVIGKEPGRIQHCACFMSPGPPWYASQCQKPRGHKGKHRFGSKRQAGRDWRKSIKS